MTRRAVITGVGHYLPKRIVPNSEFEKTLNTSDDWITTRSGIRRRHFSNEDETTSKMAILAGKQALIDANINVADLDAIILATSTACYFIDNFSHKLGHFIAIPCYLCMLRAPSIHLTFFLMFTRRAMMFTTVPFVSVAFLECMLVWCF